MFRIYIPPSARVATSNRALGLLFDAILQAKDDFNNTMIFVAGDFNKRSNEKAIEAAPDVAILPVPPKQLGASLNLAASNTGTSEIFKLLPLTSFDGLKKSDHEIIAIETVVSTTDRFTWRRYSTRPRSDKANKEFVVAVKATKWVDFLKGLSLDQKVEKFQSYLHSLMDRFFPIKYYKVRSTDNP